MKGSRRLKQNRPMQPWPKPLWKNPRLPETRLGMRMGTKGSAHNMRGFFNHHSGDNRVLQPSHCQEVAMRD